MRKWYALCYEKLSRDMIFEWRNRIAKTCNGRRTELVAHMTYPYPKRTKFGMPARCFDEMMDVEFEGYKFRCFKEYDTYLSLLYGDYMQMPPKDKQVMHLDASKILLMEPEQIFEEPELVRLGWKE